MKVLHCLSELYPLIKTGGLADVGYALPHALQQQGVDVRILLPAYREVLKTVEEFHIIGRCRVQGVGKIHHVRLLEVKPSGFDVSLWLADCSELFDRPGNPYLNSEGFDWDDNAERFSCFSQVAAQIALGETEIDWIPDLVHAHDWQTGLVPAFLSQAARPPASVFTIHNLAYSGQFSHEEFMRLRLPTSWWHPAGVEFYGGFSMLKAGLVYSDHVTTVSPGYAREILTPAFGYGMEGVLSHYQHKLSGILNGIDTATWNPADDPYLISGYGIKNRKRGKAANKKALLQGLGCDAPEAQSHHPLFSSVGRLVEQKGIDLLAAAIPLLLKQHDASFVIVGEGQQIYHNKLRQLQQQYPDQVMLYIGYSEELAHQVEAAADFFVMPSRFEPCGLNQLYSLRYGTLPIVHHVGGLADTVVDATDKNISQQTATGLVFHQATANALYDALERAIDLYAQPKVYSQVQMRAMQQDFGWQHSARQYLSLYQDLNQTGVMDSGQEPLI